MYMYVLYLLVYIQARGKTRGRRTSPPLLISIHPLKIAYDPLLFLTFININTPPSDPWHCLDLRLKRKYLQKEINMYMIYTYVYT